MSSLTSAVKTVCICRNSASLSLFGLPYRNTLFVTDASKELSFLRLDLGIIFSFLYDFREYTPYILSMRYFSKKCFSYIRFDAFISVIEWPRIPAFYPKFNFMLFSLSYCSDAKNSLSNFCTYSFICF